jgi:hypothetical protein
MILSAFCLPRQTCRDDTEIWRDGGEIHARCNRDTTEMEARWKRDGSEIWRDAGLCKFSQFSRSLSKLRRILLSGGFRVLLYSPRTCRAEVRRRRITHDASRTARMGDNGDKPRPCHRSKNAKTPGNIDLSPMSPMSPVKYPSRGRNPTQPLRQPRRPCRLTLSILPLRFENHAYPRLSTAFHGFPRQEIYWVTSVGGLGRQKIPTYAKLREPSRTFPHLNILSSSHRTLTNGQ